MASPVRQFDAAVDQERLLDVVRDLVAELGRQSAFAVIGPTAHLDRELGLGSLERVELLLRLEKTFGTRLDEHVMAEADTVEDLISALTAAHGVPNGAAGRGTITPRTAAISSRLDRGRTSGSADISRRAAHPRARGCRENASDLFRGWRRRVLH